MDSGDRCGRRTYHSSRTCSPVQNVRRNLVHTPKKVSVPGNGPVHGCLEIDSRAIGVSIETTLCISQISHSHSNDSTSHLQGSKLSAMKSGTKAKSTEVETPRCLLNLESTTQELELEIAEGQNISLLGKCEGDCDSDENCEV